MKKLVLLAALQVGAILAWAAYHERVWAHAPTFRIPLQPVDPYDVIRGRYFVLNPADGRLKTGSPDTHLPRDAVARFLGKEQYYAGPVLAAFCRVGDVQRVCDLRRVSEPLPDDGRSCSRARATIAWEDTAYDASARQVPQPGYRVSLDFGLDRFFLPDKLSLPGKENESGWELEVSYRPGQHLLPRRLWFHGQPVPTG